MLCESIVQLAGSLDQLADGERELFDRIFSVSTSHGQLVPPEPMHEWIEAHFGSVAAVSDQSIVRTTNILTWETTIFNPLRASRPVKSRDAKEVQDQIRSSQGDPFCAPLDHVPADSFGRVSGRFSVTGANIAKYDAWHGLVVFREHDPLAFTPESLADALETARQWYARAHAADPAAVYPLFIWNCLWRSGSSVVHGHAQTTLARDLPYGKIERLRRVAAQYAAQYRANYFDDLYRVHAELGLVWPAAGVRAFASLTPIKEREVLILADGFHETLANAIYHVLRTYVSKLGVASFNVAVYLPPLDPLDGWADFPVLVHLVDRGDLTSSTCDFGAVELYAGSVVSADPFAVARAMRA
ncbi:MAG: hypothetical protein M1482_16725 [Chloroflexi bacterium]|nr:hypothetical protein [Chloroflexota bacterium]